MSTSTRLPHLDLYLVLGVLLCTELAIAQQELFKLTASAGDSGDFFGSSLALSGDRAIIGVERADSLGQDSGSAYVFDVTTGQELFRLSASDGGAGQLFGFDVSISADRAVIGAFGDDDLGPQSGSAYVFDVTTGQELLKLTASDGGDQDHFGVGVAISGNRAVIGAANDDDNGEDSGSAYVFDVTTGQELFKLTASDGDAFDHFGFSVSLSGDHAIIGAANDDDNGEDSGSAYVFDVTTGQELFKLTASDGDDSDIFGIHVSISGDHAIAGAWLDENNGLQLSGSAYVFDVTTGLELFKLTPFNADAGDYFGFKVSLSGDHAVIGARAGPSLTGSAYVFDVTTGQELFHLTASDADDFDLFGSSVSISGNRVVIGSILDDDNGLDSGSAYVFALGPGTVFCPGDGSGSACPCGNSSIAGRGCLHSLGAGGLLFADGSSSSSADDLTFAALLPPGRPALLVVGTSALTGLPFGDGLRCVGGQVVRLGFTISDAGGAATWGPGLGILGGWSAGQTRNFQVHYRDVNGPCASGFNLTNGLEVTYAP